MIIREKYLTKIRPFYDQDLIKVITGIRRCGKSIMLSQIKDELINNGVKPSNIIYLNFEFEDYSDLSEHKVLNNYIEERLDKDNKNYLFFDEIQKVNKWELTINSLKSKYGDMVSIFITGSNSDLLSGELETLLAGRYISFNIFPFSFKEVLEIRGLSNKNKYELQEVLNDYMLWGGLPQRFMMRDEYQIKTYLNDIYNSIVIKDIVNRFNIKDIDLFNRIVSYIMSTPSLTFSVESLSNYLLNIKTAVSKNTIYNYLEYMCKSFLIRKADRYDIRGKRILTGKYKYYLTDLGLGQIVNKEKRQKIGAYLENIVYNELLSRGYNVTIGTFENSEIDFIATKYEKKLYFQVVYVLSDDIIINREFGVLKSIQDNYPKYVISTDNFNMSQDGIIHKNIIDWLMEEEYEN